MSIVEMSVQAGMLIIAVVIVRAIALYRLPKTSFLALWGIVVARMLIPFSVTSKWSVYNLFVSVQSPAGGSVPVEPPVAAWGDPVQLPGLVLPGDTGAPSTALAAGSLSPLEALWLVGMAVLFALFALMLVRNYWALRNAVPVTGNDFVTEWRGKYRLVRPLEIVQSDRVTSPATLGILRPRIVFPQQMDMDDGRLIRYILVHEYFHIRRFDMLWKLLALCAVCVHWFNPLAWVMLFLLNRDLELSCDEMVLRHFGGTDRAAYAHSLIDMAERNRAFSIASYFSKNAVEERIIAVMKYKKSSLLALALVLALAVGMTTAFATGAAGSSHNAGPSHDLESGLPDGSKPSDSAPQNGEAGPQNEDSALGMLTSVNRSDEDKFTPEEWKKILKEVETGNILFFETPEEERAYFDLRDPDAALEMYKDAAMVNISKWEEESSSTPLRLDNLERTTILDDDNVTHMGLTLVAVSPDDESKFSPEEWAEILEKIEWGEIRWESDETDANALSDCGNPVYIPADSGMKLIETPAFLEYNKLGNEGNAYTDLAAGAEMPVGTVTVDEGQTITVSLVCKDTSEIEVGIKKSQESGVVSSEKLTVNEADGSATAVLSIEESGEYILYVKNVGTYGMGFTISYIVR